MLSRNAADGQENQGRITNSSYPPLPHAFPKLYEWAVKKEKAMKLSARNQFKGKIVAVQKGQTTGHVRIDIGNGVIVTSSITNEAIDELALALGDEAVAIIKASDVMVGK
jgi:molybdopterin-binding protein